MKNPMIMLFSLLTVVPLLITCQTFSNEPKETMAEKMDQIRTGRDTICGMAAMHINQRGHTTPECDCGLFCALHKIACGYPDYDALESRSEPGRWYRSPDQSCFEDEESKSSWSLDMQSGWEAVTAYDGDGDRASRALTFCMENEIVGGSDLACEVGDAVSSVVAAGTVILKPAHITMMQDLVAKYRDGKSVSHASESSLPPPINSNSEGHLQVIRELTKCEVYGGITDRGLQILRKQAERQPRNPLYVAAYARYVDGDMNRAADLWLATCPTDRLPNSNHDWCDDYLFQRDYESTDKFGQRNWEPCTREDQKNQVFDGTDCAFAATVILGEWPRQ